MHSRLLVQVQAFADNLSGGDVGIGRKLEQYGFQPCIVEFPVSVKYIGSSVSVGDGADEVVEALGFINIHYVALHRQRRGVDYGRAVLTPVKIEHTRLIDRCAAHAAHVVGFRQHVAAHKVDGQFPGLPYSLIGVMILIHTDQYPVMTDNARMSYNKPVYLALDLGADDRHRLGIERQQVAEIFLVHFSHIQMFRFVLYSCSARAESGGEHDP